MKDWHELRKQGKTAYVIRHGVLLWGLSTAVIWWLAMHYFQPRDPAWTRLLVAVTVFPVGGYFVGLMSWRRNEKKYHQG